MCLRKMINALGSNAFLFENTVVAFSDHYQVHRFFPVIKLKWLAINPSLNLF